MLLASAPSVETPEAVSQGLLCVKGASDHQIPMFGGRWAGWSLNHQAIVGDISWESYSSTQF